MRLQVAPTPTASAPAPRAALFQSDRVRPAPLLKLQAPQVERLPHDAVYAHPSRIPHLSMMHPCPVDCANGDMSTLPVPTFSSSARLASSLSCVCISLQTDPMAWGLLLSRVEEAVLQEYSDSIPESPAARVAVEMAFAAADSTEAHWLSCTASSGRCPGLPQ